MAFINLPFGIAAVICSLLSKHNHSQGRCERAQHWGNVAKWLSLIGLAAAIVLFAFLVVYFVHIDKNIVDTPEELDMDEAMEDYAMWREGQAEGLGFIVVHGAWTAFGHLV